MNSKERVYGAIHYEKIDRPPRFIWLSGETRRLLIDHYGISSLELDRKLGNDIMQTWLSINGEMERDVPDGTCFVDEWGIKWKREGIYNSVCHHPLKGLSADEILDYPFPNPHDEKRYETLKGLIHQYGSDYFIGADISGSLFEPAYHLRDMEDLLMDMACGDPETDIILDKIMDFTLQVAVNCIHLDIDWIWLGDDLGTQENMLMSPKLWRKYLKPRMKHIIDEIRNIKPDMIIAYHSCGSMYPVINDLIEIGVNVLNPIQQSANGMNQQDIKDRYGDRLTLMCGLDTQQFLIHATPQDVRHELERLSSTLGKDGGYILAVSHHIQPDTPIDNIKVLFEL